MSKLDEDGRYLVQRIDDPEGKHNDCFYFVLDPAHDPHAWQALFFYAERVESTGDEEFAQSIFEKLLPIPKPEG